MLDKCRSGRKFLYEEEDNFDCFVNLLNCFPNLRRHFQTSLQFKNYYTEFTYSHSRDYTISQFACLLWGFSKLTMLFGNKLAIKLGDKNDVCCLCFQTHHPLLRSNEGCYKEPIQKAIGSNSTGQGMLVLFASSAVCMLQDAQSLAKWCSLQHGLFLFFNLLASALACAGCHSRRSWAVLGVPPAEAAWLIPGAPARWGAVEDQNLKQPCEKSVAWDPSPSRSTCAANRDHSWSLIKQSVPIWSTVSEQNSRSWSCAKWRK